MVEKAFCVLSQLGKMDSIYLSEGCTLKYGSREGGGDGKGRRREGGALSVFAMCDMGLRVRPMATGLPSVLIFLFRMGIVGKHATT